MLPMQYVHGDDNGPDPAALGTTDESTHKQYICSPVWNRPMTSTVEAGPQALPHDHCVLRPVGQPKLSDKTCSHNVR